MSRAPRHIVPGVTYHLISRFVAREYVIAAEEHRRAYLDLPAQAVARTSWRLLGLAVMSNHIHPVISVRGRKTIVVGTVEHAPLCVGQEVAILRDAGFLLTMVRGINPPGERGRHLDEAAPGDAVELVLRGVPLDQVSPGDVMMTPADVPAGARRR